MTCKRKLCLFARQYVVHICEPPWKKTARQWNGSYANGPEPKDHLIQNRFYYAAEPYAALKVAPGMGRENG